MTVKSFLDIFNSSYYSEIPEDSFVIITDLKGSTKAIQGGRYKDVNTIGAATVIAILNACERKNVLFQFGGDGAFLVVPGKFKPLVESALKGSKIMALESFEMDLRCGIIPYSELKKKNTFIKYSKFEVAQEAYLYNFMGPGISLAEEMIKNPATRSLWDIQNNQDNTGSALANFTGLECRWKPIQNRKGLFVSLIIKFSSDCSLENREKTLKLINNTAGWDKNSRSVLRSQLKLAIRPKELLSESRIYSRGFFAQIRAFFLASLSLLLGRALYRFKIKKLLPLSSSVNWRHYFDSLLDRIDNRKFDNTLRVIFDCSHQDWLDLKEKLQVEQDQRNLFFGSHLSENMLMTCMVLDHDKNHIHFVDGSEGGFTLAAKELKNKSEVQIQV